MKIACFEIDQAAQKKLKKEFSGHDVVFFEEPLSQENAEQAVDAEVVVVFIYSSIDREVLQRLDKVTLIATMSTGVDHIDLYACKQKGVVVCNVPSYGEVSVAEQTFALILALSRRLIESYQRVKDSYFSPVGLTGFDLSGKTLGVVGVGTIGKHVIRIAHGFGMQILAYTHSPHPELAQELDITLVDFDKLLTESDVVSLHVPYTTQTHHLFNEDVFKKMKKESLLINTARGAIVDTKALLSALENGQIGGAGLDVCEGEPVLHEERERMSHLYKQEDLLSVIEERSLLNYPNVIITPHNAFNTKEALEKIITTTCGNIAGFIAGKPENAVEG